MCEYVLLIFSCSLDMTALVLICVLDISYRIIYYHSVAWA